MLDSSPQNGHAFTSSQNQESEEAAPSVVPVYFLHLTGKPFCPNDRCQCHQNQAEVALLLDAIRAGEMTLREAANFADGKTL